MANRAKPTTTSEAKKAQLYHSMGWFVGCERLCRKLTFRNDNAKIWHLDKVNRFHLGKERRNGLLPDFRLLHRKLPNNQHALEVAVLLAEEGNISEAKNWIRRVIKPALFATPSRLTLGLPRATLEAAQFAAEHEDLQEEAVLLLNLAFRPYVFVDLSDLSRLADLLIQLKAPLIFWGDWCAHFERHLYCATVRVRTLQQANDRAAVLWAEGEDARSQQVLMEVLTLAPSEVLSIMIALAEACGSTPLAEVLRQRFTSGTNEPKSWNTFFSSTHAIRCRFEWFDYLHQNEKNFIINGEWALANCPTPDLSMGLAQWWRAVESALKRVLVKPLVQHLQGQSEAICSDRTLLSEAKRKKEELYIEKLADIEKSRKVGLHDIMILLQKTKQSERLGPNASQLRLSATQFISPFISQISPLVERSWLVPPLLTAENIQRFRNQSSHDAPIDCVNAVVGRWGARRLLKEFYWPIFCKEGPGFTFVVGKGQRLGVA